MDNVLTFTPRPRPAPQVEPEPGLALTLRARVEAAAEVAVDTAERLIAILDGWDGDVDLEDDVDAEPSLVAPEHHDGSQVGWCRDNDGDHEAEMPEDVLPDLIVQREPLPWGGAGNVVSAAGVAILALVAGSGA